MIGIVSTTTKLGGKRVKVPPHPLYLLRRDFAERRFVNQVQFSNSNHSSEHSWHTHLLALVLKTKSILYYIYTVCQSCV